MTDGLAVVGGGWRWGSSPTGSDSQNLWDVKQLRQPMVSELMPTTPCSGDYIVHHEDDQANPFKRRLLDVRVTPQLFCTTLVMFKECRIRTGRLQEHKPERNQLECRLCSRPRFRLEDSLQEASWLEASRGGSNTATWNMLPSGQIQGPYSRSQTRHHGCCLTWAFAVAFFFSPE